jgi:peroxiredoxin
LLVIQARPSQEQTELNRLFEFRGPSHRSGQRLPSTQLAELQDGKLCSSSGDELFAGKRVILVGVPGAFSPICSRLHLPGFINMAPKIRASGYDMIACLSANDPWVLAEWRNAIDPAGNIRFLSDGNLAFGSACGLTVTQPDFFIGTRLKRFSIIATNCVVDRIAIEASVLDVSCSSADRIGFVQD